MIITNKSNLPEVLVKMVQREKHNKENCVSATTLIKGAREVILTDRHFDEITSDVEDMVWSIFGTAVHAAIEQEKSDGVYQEKSVEAKVGNKTVTGKIDLWDPQDKVICDWKNISVNKILNSDFDDWTTQGLVYSWLLKQNGEEVKECKFYAFLKDHSKMKAKLDPKYPQSPVVTYQFDVTEDKLNMIEDFIKTRVQMIEDCEKLEDDEIPVCSESERWQTETTFAVMKKGNKMASRVVDTEEKAEGWIIAQKEKDRPLYSIVERKGESRKCKDYCSCREFCSYYKQNVKEA